MILKIEDKRMIQPSRFVFDGYIWWDGIKNLNHCERKIDPRSQQEGKGDLRYLHIIGKDPSLLPEPLPEKYEGTPYTIIIADLENGERHCWYIEAFRNIYLLNNEGKTIERL